MDSTLTFSTEYLRSINAEDFLLSILMPLAVLATPDEEPTQRIEILPKDGGAIPVGITAYRID